MQDNEKKIYFRWESASVCPHDGLVFYNWNTKEFGDHLEALHGGKIPVGETMQEPLQVFRQVLQTGRVKQALILYNLFVDSLIPEAITVQYIEVIDDAWDEEGGMGWMEWVVINALTAE